MNLNNQNDSILGLEIIADLKDCNKKTLLELKSLEFISQLSVLVKNCGLTEVGKAVNDFDLGFTCIMALAESHIAIHTWPEEQYVSLNVHVCNYSQDNSEKARYIFSGLKDIFQPKTLSYQEIIRKFN